jgi:hypothetical protein
VTASPVTSDDRREAASLVASLSSSVTSASVALLGAGVIITTYVADKYEHLIAFYVLMAAAAFALVMSLLQGGEGIFEIAAKGFVGDWRIRTDKRRFNKQVSWMLGGIALLLIGTLIGLTAKRRDTATAQSTRAIEALTNAVSANQRQVELLTHRIAGRLRTLEGEEDEHP